MTTASLKDLLSEQADDLREIKRLYETLKKVIAECSEKAIKNDLIYNDLIYNGLVFTGVDGVVLQLTNLAKEQYNIIGKIQAQHAGEFSRKKIESHLNGLDSKDNWIVSHSKKVLEDAYQKWFPVVASENRPKPKDTDFDLIRTRIEIAIKPVKDYRDTVVAHRDKKPKYVDSADFESAMKFFEELLSELSLLNHFIAQNYELGGIVANIDRTARKLSTLILGEFRVRKAVLKDMDKIFLMGIDIWGTEITKAQYLEDCRSSKKYAKGQWWVLEDCSGEPVSSMITYDLPSEHGVKVKGFGSIATAPELRKKGHARAMIHDLIDKLWHHEDVKAFYLHSDIDSKFYEKIDFIKLPQNLQKSSSSVTMLSMPTEGEGKDYSAKIKSHCL